MRETTPLNRGTSSSSSSSQKRGRSTATPKRSPPGSASAQTASTSEAPSAQPDWTPSPGLLVFSLLLYYTQRRRLFTALWAVWALIKGGQALAASDTFHSKVLLLQFTRKWPPCNFDRPHEATKLPLLLRWIDWLPSGAGLDDLKSFPGIRNSRPLSSLRKRKVGAWIVAPEDDENVSGNKKRRSVVLYFRGRSGHRGTRSRVRMYERLRSKPLHLHCASFDGNDEELSSERGQLEDAHAVWSALTRAPYGFGTDSVIIWGCALGCCSAANLCLYLMRRGTPPAALVLENPATSFPKLIASRFEFLGEHVQNIVEQILKSNLRHRFDLEKRIRSICNLDIEVPLLLISAEKDWTVPPSHAQKLADMASALTASKRVRLLTVPTSRQGLAEDPNFFQAVSSFLAQALADAGKDRRKRTISLDYIASPSTQSDFAAEDRLFAMDENNRSFNL